MSQLQSPVQTPAQTRKRVRSGTPPGTPVGDDNDITAVDDSDVDSEEDSDDDGDDSDEEDEAPFAGMAIPTPPAGPHEAWWNAHYTPLSPPATEDLGFDQIQIQYNPKHWTRNYLEYDILSPDDTLESFLDAHRIQKGGLCSHTAMNGWRGGAWFIPKCLNREFLLLFFRDSIMAKKPIPLTEKYLRGYEFYFFMDWEMPSKEMYNDFLATNRLEDLQFLRLFAGLCDFARPGKYNRVRLIFSRNPDHPNKMHINYDLAVTSEEATRFCVELQARFLARFVSDHPAYNWDKIFDKGPYNNGGLRILGACKEGQLSSYQILDLHSGVYEPLHVQQLIATSMRTEYREGDAPLYGNLGTTVCSEHDALLRKYVDELKAAKAFPSQSLDFKEVKPGFNGKSYVVNLADRFCSLEGRSHARQSAHMYLFVTRDGTWLKCYNEECRSKNSKLNEPNPPYITDLFPKEIEITEDICGGGESEDEARVHNSRLLSKGILTSLYVKKGKSHNQPAFTDYLNGFVTYVHANDTYGFRHDQNLPFILGKKSTISNKLERYNANFDAFNIWCRNDNRREFHRCVFDTSTKVYGPDVLNLFKGYKAHLLDEQISAESVEIFLFHLRDIYCSGNDRDYQYLLRWWAWLFQRGRTGVMVILMSAEKGTGKNLLLELIAEHIIGDEYVVTTDKITTITQKFNALNAEKVLIVANELKDATKSKKEQKGVVEVLKTLIKDRTMTIEKKGIDPLGVPSTTNYIGTSNNVTPIKIDPDQRRFFALKVSNAKKGDSEYFKTLSTFVQENANHIFTFLSQFDLAGWAPEKDLPQTDYVKEIQAAFKNPIYTFWDYSEWSTHDFDAIPTNSEKIFDQYLGWCQRFKADAPAFPWFGRLIREMGYTVTRETRYGERAQWISGNMSEDARKLMNAN